MPPRVRYLDFLIGTISAATKWRKIQLINLFWKEEID